MSTGSEPSWLEDPEGAAGEYVLGTLPAAERAAFERALAADSTLRATVRVWEAHLVGLAAGTSPVTPDTRTWAAISTRLSPRSATAAESTAGARVVRLERAVRRWRFVAAGAGAVAAGLALFLAMSGPFRAPAPQYVAVVNRGGELPALVVRLDTNAGIVQVRSLATETPPDRNLELWYVGSGSPPRSLGVITEPTARLPVPTAMRESADGGTLAVSVEPKGGSPTGAPTGPVIYSGRLIRE